MMYFATHYRDLGYKISWQKDLDNIFMQRPLVYLKVSHILKLHIAFLKIKLWIILRNINISFNMHIFSHWFEISSTAIEVHYQMFCIHVLLYSAINSLYSLGGPSRVIHLAQSLCFFSWQIIPIYWFAPICLEVVIALGEMFTTKESSVGW